MEFLIVVAALWLLRAICHKEVARTRAICASVARMEKCLDLMEATLQQRQLTSAARLPS